MLATLVTGEAALRRQGDCALARSLVFHQDRDALPADIRADVLSATTQYTVQEPNDGYGDAAGPGSRKIGA